MAVMPSSLTVLALSPMAGTENCPNSDSASKKSNQKFNWSGCVIKSFVQYYWFWILSVK